jgi:hypothetical protein
MLRLSCARCCEVSCQTANGSLCYLLCSPPQRCCCQLQALALGAPRLTLLKQPQLKCADALHLWPQGGPCIEMRLHMCWRKSHCSHAAAYLPASRLPCDRTRLRQHL